MFCVNKVSKKFSTTGGESKKDGGLFNGKKRNFRQKEKRKTIIFHYGFPKKTKSVLKGLVWQILKQTSARDNHEPIFKTFFQNLMILI